MQPRLREMGTTAHLMIDGNTATEQPGEVLNRWVRATVEVRFLVASLGETAAPPWWRSEATSPVGLRMLERLFPRTAATASLQTASQAARLEHDARIGRSGVYHLFRLPSAAEATLLDLLTQPEIDSRLRQLAGIDLDEKARLLAKIAASHVLQSTEGPVYCGAVGDLRIGDALARICTAYHVGFQTNRIVYPYLTEEPA